MKLHHYIFFNMITIFLSCCSNKTEHYVSQNNESIKIDSIAILKKQILDLQKEIEILKYPADQRLISIKEMISSGNLDAALINIEELENTFPYSAEAKSCINLKELIESKKAAIKAEQERLESLGFKALREKTNFTIGYNTISLSKITTSNQFTFDAYDDRWFYRDADRGNKYITMAMSVKSSDKNPQIPQFAVYSVSGKNMSLIGTFTTEYARWSDYGCYLGNYHDSRNDFAKVSTVHFNLGCEVSTDILTKPYAIIVMNKNVLSENYDRFKNPPQYWTGYAAYPNQLSIHDFEMNYTLVKIYNLK